LVIPGGKLARFGENHRRKWSAKALVGRSRGDEKGVGGGSEFGRKQGGAGLRLEADGWVLCDFAAQQSVAVGQQAARRANRDRSEQEESGIIPLGGNSLNLERRGMGRGEQYAILALDGVEGGDEDDREVVVGPQNRRQEDDFRHHSYPFL
jgi:hypothetical protein